MRDSHMCFCLNRLGIEHGSRGEDATERQQLQLLACCFGFCINTNVGHTLRRPHLC